LVEFLANFAVFHVFLSISRDFADIPEFRGSATARNFRSPVTCYNCHATCFAKKKNLGCGWLSLGSNNVIVIVFQDISKCVCQRNTDGHNCERCLPLFNNKPYQIRQACEGELTLV